MLALIGIAASMLLPSVGSVLAGYHLESAGDDMQVRLARVRLAALEQSVPYAFAYQPEADRFMTWACEPLMPVTQLAGLTSGTIGQPPAPGGDLYDRRQFELNDRSENREFRFLAVGMDESLVGMGLSSQARAVLAPTVSAESIAASRMLSQRKLALATISTRSLAAMQISGLELGGMSAPIVFEPDGTADRDAIIRIADRRGRYIEIMVHGLSGAITRARARSISELPGAAPLAVSDDTGPGLTLPSRSREITSGGSP